MVQHSSFAVGEAEEQTIELRRQSACVIQITLNSVRSNGPTSASAFALKFPKSLKNND